MDGLNGEKDAAYESASVHPASSSSNGNPVHPVSFFVGQQFQSFEDLQRHLKLYESQHFGVETHGQTKRHRKKVNRPLSEYYDVTYRCIHGGRKFKARGEGK